MILTTQKTMIHAPYHRIPLSVPLWKPQYFPQWYPLELERSQFRCENSHCLTTTLVTAVKDRVVVTAVVMVLRFFCYSKPQASLKHNLILLNALTSPRSLRICKSCLVTIGIFKPYPTILPYGENSKTCP